MKSISKLKDEARKHEQREEWEKAIQAYLQVLRIAEESEEEVELPLYNRLGDLCVRLGRPQEAVRHYEQAADRYAEAGLYNNAIALCNKALRYSPDRLELIRKLGQFSASQGFITDARRYFLDYAERQFKAGKVTEALTALEDFANVSDDAEIREMLGRQLHAHGRINDAIDELRRAHAMHLREGDTQRAEVIRVEILAIDPHASLEEGAAPRGDPARPAVSGALPGLVDIDTGAGEAFEEPDTGAIDGLEIGALPDDGAGLDAIQVTGYESTGELVLDDTSAGGPGGIEGLETTTFDFGSVDAEAAELESPDLEREAISFGDASGGDAEAFDLPLLHDPDAGFDLPSLEDDSGSSFDLPLLGDDDPSPAVEEATPLQEPEIDGMIRPLDLSSSGGPAGVDIPGDLALPLDLTSFGNLGISPFELPPLEDENTVAPAWESAGPPFELPAIDDDLLEAPVWEAESAAPLDLPAFDAGEVEFVDIPSFEAESEPELPAVESVDSIVEPPVTHSAEAPAAPPDDAIEIPAIELPTWDTDFVAEIEEEAFDLSDQTEPTWIDATEQVDDETAPDLPTFTYEEEPDSAQAEVVGEDEEVLTEDDDPLGLAAHLPPRTAGTPPPEPPRAKPKLRESAAPVQPPAPELAPVVGEDGEPVDSDWLDDIADDEPAPWGSSDALDGETAPGAVSSAAPDVEDLSADAGRAAEAAREMAATPPPVAPAGGQNRYVDLGALVTGDDDEISTRFRVQETAPTGDEDRDFAELLSQFKAKVQEHLPPEDAAAHYDLGLAFKEMGLIDEAIGEFQVALRAGHMRLKVYEELGQCFLQKEQYNIAEKVLSRALEMKFEDELELLGVYYHLGRAYEALGRRDQARDAYERVLGMDINFGDVTARLARL